MESMTKMRNDLDVISEKIDQIIADRDRLRAENEKLRDGLTGARDWVAQYLQLPGHKDAAQSRLNLIDSALTPPQS